MQAHYRHHLTSKGIFHDAFSDSFWTHKARAPQNHFQSDQIGRSRKHSYFAHIRYISSKNKGSEAWLLIRISKWNFKSFKKYRFPGSTPTVPAEKGIYILNPGVFMQTLSSADSGSVESGRVWQADIEQQVIKDPRNHSEAYKIKWPNKVWVTKGT